MLIAVLPLRNQMKGLAFGIEAADQAMYAQRQKMRGPANLQDPAVLPLTPRVLLDVH